eukprot:4787142-Amphidinium_carterae.2
MKRHEWVCAVALRWGRAGWRTVDFDMMSPKLDQNGTNAPATVLVPQMGASSNLLNFSTKKVLLDS